LPGYRVKLSYLAIPNREPEHAKAVRSLGRQMDRICSVVDLHERYPAPAYAPVTHWCCAQRRGPVALGVCSFGGASAGAAAPLALLAADEICTGV
jgi:hypothetical protein